jgi:hypothetical protein
MGCHNVMDTFSDVPYAFSNIPKALRVAMTQVNKAFMDVTNAFPDVRTLPPATISISSFVSSRPILLGILLSPYLLGSVTCLRRIGDTSPGARGSQEQLL